ncbi:O-antigen ligase family protein [Roseobacter sp. CCS2]|uniref:O-antigen ligase family protein n=1 Tax=Roseobacter sp. CCS2 TaxID=391593 RepID=UPI0000F403D2|nr:O-antigen ligase family protein [Roseobacter sp. CCS2]EBA13100.1 O-antigen polymerase [Roseobacter sp. CCS2]
MRTVFRILEFAIALFGLFFMTGSLTTYLTPQDAETAPLVQLIGASLGVFAILVLVSNRGAVSRILAEYWLALLPVGFAIVSLAWSEDLALTLRRAGGLSLTTAFAFWLALRFNPAEIFRLVVLTAVTVILANYLYILQEPSRGIHQSYDLVGAQHAGSWRGLFGHKNDFGRVIAFVASILLVGFALGKGQKYLRWLAMPLAGLVVLLIIKTSSSQAVLLGAAVPVIMAVFLGMRSMSAPARSLVLIIALPFAVIGLLSAQLLFEYLLGLLGRDATLTGRTIIWEGVFIALGGNVVAGGGYGAGWQVVGPQLTALTGFEVGHAHNGFLDLAVDIGVVGLGMTLVFMMWLGSFAFSNLMRGHNPELSAIALTVVVFSLIGNVAGSFLLQHNSIFWVLAVATFAKLKERERAAKGAMDRDDTDYATAFLRPS